MRVWLIQDHGVRANWTGKLLLRIVFCLGKCYSSFRAQLIPFGKTHVKVSDIVGDANIVLLDDYDEICMEITSWVAQQEDFGQGKGSKGLGVSGLCRRTSLCMQQLHAGICKHKIP